MPKTNIKVKLDGNVFAILGQVESALKKAGREDLYREFLCKVVLKDYDYLLATCAEYVEVS